MQVKNKRIWVSKTAYDALIIACEGNNIQQVIASEALEIGLKELDRRSEILAKALEDEK